MKEKSIGKRYEYQAATLKVIQPILAFDKKWTQKAAIQDWIAAFSEGICWFCCMCDAK